MDSRTQQSCLDYIGSKFHVILDSPNDMTEKEVGQDLLKKVCLVHLDNDTEKFNLLMFVLGLI